MSASHKKQRHSLILNADQTIGGEADGNQYLYKRSDNRWITNSHRLPIEWEVRL